MRKRLKVFLLDYDTGEVIDTYNSMTEAADDNYITCSQISKAIRYNGGYCERKKLRFAIEESLLTYEKDRECRVEYAKKYYSEHREHYKRYALERRLRGDYKRTRKNSKYYYMVVGGTVTCYESVYELAEAADVGFGTCYKIMRSGGYYAPKDLYMFKSHIKMSSNEVKKELMK